MTFVNKYAILLFYCSVFFVQISFAQESMFDYQIILETKGMVSARDRHSKANPNNWMRQDPLSTMSQLYPILTFRKSGEKTDVKVQIEGLFNNYNFSKDSTSFSFQELYTQFEWEGRHFFIFGKRRLDWGTGVVWNPSNFFIQKDPLRTQNRLEGIWMLNYSFLWRTSALSFYFFPENQSYTSKAAVKCDFSHNRLDMSFSFVEYGRFQQFGYDLVYGGDQFTAYSESVLKNYTKNYRLSEGGELIAPENQKKEFRVETIVGTTVVFNSHLSFTGEYRYREDGLSRKEIDIYKQKLPTNLVLFDPLSVGKHTLFGQLEYKDNYGRWSVSLRSFYDAISGQLTCSPVGIISLSNFQIEWMTLFYSKALSIHNFQTSLLVSCFF